MTRVLLTTVHRPLGVESDACTPNIQAEMYHAQLTRAQGPFSIRSVCTGGGIEFIAANLEDLFRREYEALGPSVCRILDTQLAGWLALKDRCEQRSHVPPRTGFAPVSAT